MRSLFDPQGFYFFAGKTIKPLFALAAVLAAVALYLGFLFARLMPRRVTLTASSSFMFLRLG